MNSIGRDYYFVLLTAKEELPGGHSDMYHGLNVMNDKVIQYLEV